MTPEVEEAIADIRRQFPSTLVGPDKDGGACVIVEDVALGPRGRSWIGFHITHQCPYADVYPHFIRADFFPAGAKLPEGLSTSHSFPAAGVVVATSALPSRPAMQVSRRANKRDDSGIETPLVKLLKVISWIGKQ